MYHTVESRDPSRVTDAQSGQSMVFDSKVENRSLDDTSTRLKEKNDPHGSFTTSLHWSALVTRYDMA
jgi:hypothetical protein